MVGPREPLIDVIAGAELLIDWRQDHNTERPHTSLDGFTPDEFASRFGSDHNQREPQF